MRKKEAVTENQSFTCPNPVCGRNFSNPIKATNLGSRDQAYDACPYCLTEILVEETHPAIENEQDSQEKETETEPVKRLKMPAAKEEQPKPELKAEGCQHHFGYLGERQSKERIPDECMTCESIVKCMLKNVAT
jgi:hypothetical protein